MAGIKTPGTGPVGGGEYVRNSGASPSPSVITQAKAPDIIDQGDGADTIPVYRVDTDALQLETQDSLTHAAEDLETKVGNLPFRQRLSALLGFTKDVEAKYLPSEFKAVQITIPRYRLADVQRILEEYALPVNANFLGNPNDPTVTLTYVVPNNVPVSNNYLNIVAKLKAMHVEFSTAIAQNEPIVIRAKGQGLNIIGPDFSKVQTYTIESALDDEFTSKGPAAAFFADDVDEELSPPPPLDPETIYASRHSQESAKEDLPRIPRQGGCMYLMIEDKFIDKIARRKDDKEQEKNPYLYSFLNQLAAIHASPNFCITRQNGYILIVNTAERAGSYLTSLATSIFVASDGSTKALVGSGNISHSQDGESFSLAGTMPTSQETSPGGEVFELMPGVHLHTEIYDPGRKRLKGRDGSQNHTVAAATKEGGHWLRLKEHKPSVELAVGGPDKFIGYEKELADLEDALNDDHTKLTILRAAAGIGKSRSLSEVAKNNPSMIVLSIDPSGKKVQGSGLVTVATQLMQHVINNVDEQDLEGQQIMEESRKFLRMTQSQKEKMAQNKPQSLIAFCTTSFNFLRKKLGKLKVVLDDVHHIDRHSDAHVMGLMSALLSGDSHDKVVLSMRPEERYDSSVQKTFEAQVKGMGSHTVKGIYLNGLDFGNEQISYDFIYHSLPEEFRKGKKLGGNWWKKLGAHAGRLPLAMVTFMNAIMAEHNRLTAEEKPSVLTTPEKQIMLSDDFVENLCASIPDGDLGRYYKENINKLPEHLKVLMQSIALLGGEVTEVQLRQIREVTGEISIADIENILVSGRYLIPAEGRYRVQHQTIVDSMVGSIDHKQKVDLSTKLYAAFKKDSSIGNDTKLALLHNVAPQATAEDSDFWLEYGSRVGKSLEGANKTRSYGRNYGTAMTVLGLPLAEIEKLPPEERTEIQKVLEELANPTSPKEIAPIKVFLVASVLENLGRSAMMLGKLGEAEEAFTKLAKILVYMKGSLKNQKNLYIAMFQLAYLKKDAAQMEQIYEEKIKSIATFDTGVRAVMELQIRYIRAFTTGGNVEEGVDSVNESYAEQSSKLSALRKDPAQRALSLEVTRLVHARVPFELVRDEAIKMRLSRDQKRAYGAAKRDLSKDEREATLKSMGNKKLDEDILLQKGVFDESQLRTLIDIDGILGTLTKQQSQFPEAFSTHAGMSLLDIRAQVAAMLGRPQEAVDALSEYWRQADQMEVHEDAARAAKLKGDVQMVQAFSRHTIDRDRVLEAIRTYGEEGVKSLTTVDKKSFYHISVRINRIRAVGALAMSYAYEIKTRQPKDGEVAQMKQEFQAHLETALKDFEYLNTERPRGSQSGEVQYYLMGYLGHVLRGARDFGLEVPNLSQSPYATLEGLKRALKFSEEIEDNPQVDLGEKKRKMEGVEAMQDFVA